MTAPTTERTSLSDALDHVRAEPVLWTRAAAVLADNGTWTVRLLELVSGPIAPPSWDADTWEYPRALFVAQTLGGPAVADQLDKRTWPAGIDLALPELSDSVMWERRQSRATAAYETLEWPVTEATLSLSVATQPEPPGHLISPARAPSFVNFYTAASAFFWLSRQPVGGSLHQGLVYRHQDSRARVTHVRVTGDEVVVDLEGDRLDGLVVELAGESPGRVQQVWDRSRARSARATFTLDEGLPRGAWVLVRAESDWIDRRFLAVPWTRGDDAGVEFVIEPGTRLETFLAAREGPTVEFKQRVPDDDEGKRKVMKTVCAFANGDGGSLLFGVTDDHDVVGVPAATIDRLKDQLTQTVGSWVEPRPRVAFETLPTSTEESLVLEMRVEGAAELYGSARPGDTPTVYIRHHAISVKARPREIEHIVRSRTPGSPVPYWARL